MSDETLPARSRFYTPGSPEYTTSFADELNEEKQRIELGFVNLETLIAGGGASEGSVVFSTDYPNEFLEGVGFEAIEEYLVANVTSWCPALPADCLGASLDRFCDRFWLIGGGLVGSKRVYYSADGQAWTQIADAPWGSRCFHGSFVYNNRLYVVGGKNGLFGNPAYTDVWYLYENPPGSGVFAWAQAAANGGFGQRWLMSKPVFFDSKWWMVGGGVQLAAGYWPGTSDVYSSTDGASWSLVASNQFPERCLPFVTVHDNKLWVIFGSDLLSWWQYLFFGNAAAYMSSDIWTSDDGATWDRLVQRVTNVFAIGGKGIIKLDGRFLLNGTLAFNPFNGFWVTNMSDPDANPPGRHWYVAGNVTGNDVVGTMETVTHNNEHFCLRQADLYKVSFSKAPIQTFEGIYVYKRTT